MPIRVRQRNEDMIVIRTKNGLESSFILDMLAKLKWMPEGMRPGLSVKNIKGEEIDIPKPELHMPSTIKPSGSVVTIGADTKIQSTPTQIHPLPNDTVLQPVPTIENKSVLPKPEEKT